MKLAQATDKAKGKRLAVFSALRHRNYRLYWVGMLISITGWQIQMVAQGWLVYQLTGSPAFLGLAGLSSAMPTIILTLFGGVLADRMDRRKLMMLTQSLTALLIFILATLAATEMITVWHVIAIAFLMGAVWAFDQPTRMALIPNLVGREDLMNAIAMGSMAWQGSRIVGPALAGVLISLIGIPLCFYMSALGFVVMIGALFLVQFSQAASSASQENVLRNLTEGVGFIAKRPIFSTLIGMTFFDSIFGMSYVTLMPVFAKDILAVGSSGFGFLMGASGVGALMGTTIVAALGNYRYKGRLLLSGAALFGTAIILFSLSRWFPFSLAILAGAGAANSLYMTTVNTLLQSLVPDELRGRVMGVYGLTWSLMPLGGMLGGTVATLVNAPFAVAIGGSLVVALASGVALKIPMVRRL